MTEWTRPMFWSDEDVEHWKTLDHGQCPVYNHQLALTDAPDWQLCGGMHCPDCGKKTGSQGHKWPNEKGERVCPTPESERKPWPLSWK